MYTCTLLIIITIIVITTITTHHARVSTITLCSRDATMFHDPFKRSPLLSSITAIVTKAPCTVH